MAKFNPDDYEDVASRLRRFKADYPDSRIITELDNHTGEIRATRWVVVASVFKDREVTVPDATGWAMEVDGSGMANNTSALENCETSAIGRALANLGYSGDRRATRQEMEKVQREEARQEDIRKWADSLMGFERRGDTEMVRRGMEWAQGQGDREKYDMAHKVLERMTPTPQEAQDTAQTVLDAEVVTDAT